MDKNHQELDKILRTSCLSSFIFAISALEDEFGYLWGEEKDESEPLTAEEQQFFEMFIKWRKKVLDYGNLQIREGQSRVCRTLGKIYGQK